MVKYQDLIFDEIIITIMRLTNLHWILFANIVLFVVINLLVVGVLQTASAQSVITISIWSAIAVTIHIFIAIGLAVFYRIKYFITDAGRGWFWSAIVLTAMGLMYFIYFAYLV
jgi:hypothetical protein